MRAVAFSGKSGSGRGQAAQMLLAELRAREIDVLAVSFGDLLAEEASPAPKAARDWARKLREHYQLRRSEDPDYWPKRLSAQIERLDRAGVLALVPEVDRRGDAELLRGLGVLLVRVDASRPVRAKRLEARGLGPELARSQDPSEAELDGYDFDFTIKNSSSEEYLRRQVRQLAKRLLAGP